MDLINSKNTFYLVTVIFVVTGIIYFPGLNTRFLFDDIYNLHGLSDIKVQGWLYFIFGSGFSGPGGRPLSLFTFALQHTNWPDNPFAFKFINLLIHIINAVLVFIFSKLLITQTQKNKVFCSLFATIVMVLWILHPIHVNTVLYTIQRMTMISTTFILIGMICYIYGRNLINNAEIKKGFGWICFSIYICTTIAITGKEIGILLPAFLMLSEFIFFSNKTAASRIKTCIWALISFPLIIFSAYLLFNIEGLAANFTIREFSPEQRILTEFRVVMDYLSVITIPHSGVFSLFHDGYKISTSILNPPTTLISILTITAMIIFSIAFKRPFPVIAFGLLFFLTGHLLEAGPISLNLYFEHRNYLPSLGIIFVISMLVTMGLSNNLYKKYALGFIVIYSFSLMVILYDQVNLWRNPLVQTISWSLNYPESRLAKQELVNIQLENGNISEAKAILNNLSLTTSNDIYTDIRGLQIDACIMENEITLAKQNQLERKLKNPIEFNFATISVFDYLVLDVIRNQCPGLKAEYLENIISLIIANPDAVIDKAILHELLSSLALNKGDLDSAVIHMRNSLSLHFDAERKLREITLLKRMQQNEEFETAKNEMVEYLNSNFRAKLAYNEILTNLQ